MSIQVVSYEINDVDGKIEWMFLGTVDVPKPEPAPKLKHQQILVNAGQWNKILKKKQLLL